jgi:hypothetical protein
MSQLFTPLRRLSALLRLGKGKVRETDWWGVLVELMVVVVGILIAFELSNWGERRQRASQEQHLLQRIEEEARGDYNQLELIRDQHLQSVENYRLLDAAVRNPRAHDQYHQRGDAQCNLLRLPAVQRHSAASGGLAAGERVEQISDEKLRILLRRADANRVFSDSQLGFFRESFQRYASVIEPHMPWRMGNDGPETFRCGVNIDTLRADPAAVALLPKLARDQAQFAHYRQQELVATKSVIERVSCLRVDTCNP